MIRPMSHYPHLDIAHKRLHLIEKLMSASHGDLDAAYAALNQRHEATITLTIAVGPSEAVVEVYKSMLADSEARAMIHAVKAQRVETGLGLADSKRCVDAWIKSGQLS